jgi:hypothetical protein
MPADGRIASFRSEFATTPRKADYVWTTIARVLSVAKNHGKVAINVCEKGGRLYDSDRSDVIWLADDIREFCSVASVQLQAALLLAVSRPTPKQVGVPLKLAFDAALKRSAAR